MIEQPVFSQLLLHGSTHNVSQLRARLSQFFLQFLNLLRQFTFKLSRFTLYQLQKESAEYEVFEQCVD
jgi:hypothetical protein